MVVEGFSPLPYHPNHSHCATSLSQCPGGGRSPQSHPPTPTPRPKTCRYPRCQRPCYVERDGRVHDFCGRTHADRYRAEQTRSSRAAWSHHTEDEPQGLFWWMAGACVLCISTMLMYCLSCAGSVLTAFLLYCCRQGQCLLGVQFP